MRHLRHWATFLPALLLPIVVIGPPQSSLAQDTVSSGVLGQPIAVECAGSPGESVAPEGVTAAAWEIVSEESVARYRAQEELASVGTSEAVGETNAIIGSILLDEGGMPVACSRFDVDLRTLTSDQARRDNFLYENTLETGEYPLATFVLTGVEGLDAPLAEGEEVELTLVGNLTMHGETKSIAWATTATLEGDTLTGVASTTFNMADFAIEEPVVGPVVSVDEIIELEVEIVAQRAA